MSKLCKGGCGRRTNFKGWCAVKWISGRRFAVNCPEIEKKRAKAISKYRIEEAKLGKNPMQNPEICRKNHSPDRNRKAAQSLKMLGQKGLLPQQIESPELKEKRRAHVIKSLKRLWSEGKHPLQNETLEEKQKRHQKISNTVQKLAEQKKLFVQNMTKVQKREFGKKISKTLRDRIRSGQIILSPSWKKVHYGNKILRSNWEKETAQFLDKHHMLWLYEPFVVPYYDSSRQIRANTIPDFYLPKFNTIIEVKSNAYFNSIKTKDKLIALRKAGYNVLLFGRKQLKLIQENKEEELIKLIKNEKNQS